MLTRRSFIEQSALALGALTCLEAAFADVALAAKDTKSGPLGLPIGIQLYTVRAETAKDLEGTLKKISDIGYREVELAGYYDKSPKELSTLLKRYSLAAPSAHRGLKDVLANPDKEIDYLREMGVSYLVIPFPAVKDDRFANQPADAQKTIANSTTLDDWKWIAESLNKIAEKAKRAGLRTGYHNHQEEFKRMGGERPMDLLARDTGKDVMLQFDVGTCVEAGSDPVAWVKQNPGRIRSLHLKDWSPDRGYRVLFGEGTVPWKEIFQAAEHGGGVEFYLIEQEGSDYPPFETARRCLATFKKIHG